MRVIYPFNPLNEKEADEPYQAEYLYLCTNGVSCSLFDFDALEYNEFKPKPRLEEQEIILYRGWMLNPHNYEKLVKFIESKGAIPLTSTKNYLKCHHLPNWYESCAEFTPESVFFPNDCSLIENVRTLGWNEYFIKDFVKSNTTERGSIATSPEAAADIVRLIETYRGVVEGGVAVRRVEQYVDNTELRYFVFNGVAYSPDGNIPDIVTAISKLVAAPFFSVDIVQRSDGVLRLVELGDGQVSDKKTWSTSAFGNMLLAHADKDLVL